MPQGSLLTFVEVVRALRAARCGYATAGTLASRLHRSVKLVERALVALRDCRIVTCLEQRTPNGTRRVWKMTGIVFAIPNGGIEPERGGKPLGWTPRDGAESSDGPPPYVPVAEVADDADPDGTMEESAALTAIQFAERLWRARMDGLRWRDDPRALAEPWRPQPVPRGETFVPSRIGSVFDHSAAPGGGSVRRLAR